MKKILVTVLVLILFFCTVFLYIGGSEWVLISREETPIYARDDTSIAASTALVVARSGEKLQVVRCIFNKVDAYLVVRNGDGIVGFAFDHNQHFVQDWRFSLIQLDSKDFFEKLTCWNLVGQFGI